MKNNKLQLNTKIRVIKEGDKFDGKVGEFIMRLPEQVYPCIIYFGEGIPVRGYKENELEKFEEVIAPGKDKEGHFVAFEFSPAKSPFENGQMKVIEFHGRSKLKEYLDAEGHRYNVRILEIKGEWKVKATCEIMPVEVSI